MKILISGSAGFIGFNLAFKLLKLFPKYKVLGVDNFDKYYSVNLKKNRIKILKKYKNFIFKNLDINNKKKLNKFLDNNKPDIVYHLAAQAGVRYSLINPEKYVDTNIKGFFNLCEISRKNNVNKFFYASSSSVYGESNSFPLNENDKINPKNIYGLSKKINEQMAEMYSFQSKIKFVGLRFFTVYGPWGRPDMMMMKYISSSIKNKKFELFNYGNHTRDFTYIDDVTSILIKFINKKISRHDIFNICSSKPINLKIILRKLNKHLNKVNLVKKPMQQADVKKTHGSNKKIRKFLRYNKFCKIDDGIANTVKWYKKYIKYNKI